MSFIPEDCKHNVNDHNSDLHVYVNLDSTSTYKVRYKKVTMKTMEKKISVVIYNHFREYFHTYFLERGCTRGRTVILPVPKCSKTWKYTSSQFKQDLPIDSFLDVLIVEYAWSFKKITTTILYCSGAPQFT